MKRFYKIVDKKAYRGHGYIIPDGNKEYTVGKEPQELIDGLVFKTPSELKEDAKLDKEKALNELTITHNTVAYDANGTAIGNMSAVMGVANFKFNQLLAQDILASDAYQIIYKETTIFWKGVDNLPHEVMIESVCETLELSMQEVATIIGL